MKKRESNLIRLREDQVYTVEDQWPPDQRTKGTVAPTAPAVRKEPWTVRFEKWLTLELLKLVAFIACCLVVSHYVWQAWDWGLEEFYRVKEKVVSAVTVEKLVTEYREPDQATLSDVIQRESRKVGLDPLILAVIAKKESSDGVALYRYEPKLFDRLTSSGKYANLSADERRMLASSHGPFHVLGLTAQQECNGLPWHRLYDLHTSAHCAATIVSKLDKRHAAIKDPSDRLWAVFKNFNGSGSAAEAYADHAMRLVGKALYGKMLAKKGSGEVRG